MFGYKKVKFDLTKKEIRELKEGRAGFIIDKEKRIATFMNPEEVGKCFRQIVKELTSSRPVEQIGILEPLETMERNGWLFAHSFTQFGYMKIDEYLNRAKIFIDTRNYTK